MEHSYFGVLEYSEKLDWYSSEFSILGATVPLYISAKGGEVDLETAEQVVRGLSQEADGAIDTIVAELYETYRENWSNFVTRSRPKSFRKKLQLISIVVFVTGDADLYFDDGGLFMGHDVVVRYEPGKGYFNTRLTG